MSAAGWIQKIPDESRSLPPKTESGLNLNLGIPRSGELVFARKLPNQRDDAIYGVNACLWVVTPRFAVRIPGFLRACGPEPSFPATTRFVCES